MTATEITNATAQGFNQLSVDTTIYLYMSKRRTFSAKKMTHYFHPGTEEHVKNVQFRQKIRKTLEHILDSFCSFDSFFKSSARNVAINFLSFFIGLCCKWRLTKNFVFRSLINAKFFDQMKLFNQIRINSVKITQHHQHLL